MKKGIYLIALLTIVSFALTGCGPKNTTSSSGEESVKGSLLDLVKAGKNVRCTFSSNDENGLGSGETFVSGTKFRSDFNITQKEGAAIESHTISDGEWMYIWSSVSEQGTKMKIADVQNNPQQNTEAPKGSSSADAYKKSLDYKCSPWVPDSSKFNVPTNITFVDFTETLKNIQDQANKAKEGAKSMCGVCSMAGSAEKIAECKKNLGCE